jgi:SAM-dependent methyltransferase
LFFEFLHQNQAVLCKVIISSKEDNYSIDKVEYTVLKKNGHLLLQKSYVEKNQAFHQNFSIEEGIKHLADEFMKHFRQALVKLQNEDVQFVKNGAKLKKKIVPANNTQKISHNRLKQVVYQEGIPQEFLIETGLMEPTGKVKAQMQHKFKQMNKFLEVCEKHFQKLVGKTEQVTCVDIGCGKGYLTFALYDLLKRMGFKEISVIGIDLKEEVLKKNTEIANRLKMEGLQFHVIDANQCTIEKKVDVVIALHACNTATDMAIKSAILWNAQAIFLAPCCQKELLSQIQSLPLRGLLKYGILKERFNALLTDALRAGFLENHGYAVEMIEFVDREDSLKNILLKAVKVKKNPHLHHQEYQDLKQAFSVTPWLDQNL